MNRCRWRTALTAALLLSSSACALPRATPPPERVLPRPLSGEDDLDDRRRAWIEQLHRAAPGVDWRQVERENRRDDRARRAAIAKQEAFATSGTTAAAGAWLQRGANDVTGRTWVTAVSGDGITLLVGSGDGAGGGLSSGTPGTKSWRQRGTLIGSGVQQIVAMPGSPETWVAGTNGSSEILVSTDQGASWQSPTGLPDPPCGYLVTRLLREPGASRTVYVLLTAPGCETTSTFTLLRSDDAGLSFVSLLTGTYSAAPDLWMSRVAAGPLYLLTDAGLEASLNQGGSFTLVGTLPGAAGTTLRLAGSEGGAPALYAFVTNGGETAVYASADAGRTWQAKTTVTDFFSPNGAVTASISNPSVVMLGGVDAYRSTDGGATFDLVNDWPAYLNDPVTKLHADVRGLDSSIYQGQEVLFADTDGGTFLSTDLGATFQNITEIGMLNAEYYSTLTAGNDPNLVAAGAQDQGLQQSTPAQAVGMGFQQLISGDYGHLSSTRGEPTLFYAVYPGFVLVVDQGSPVDSEDFPTARNRSWMPNILADPADANAVYLTGDPLYRLYEDSAGWHWTALPQNFSGGTSDYLTAFAISPVNSSYWYAASSQGRLWYSHNQGATWTESSSTGPAAHYFYGTALLPSTTSATTCFVGGSGYSGPAVYKTTNGGVTWQEMANGLPNTVVLGLAFDSPVNQNLYAAAEAGAYMFDQASSTWKSIIAGKAPLQGYWSVEGVPALSAVRFGTYGQGIWDYSLVPLPGLSFYTLAPCRVIDTRGATGSLGGPALQPAGTRIFTIAGICGLPSTARAVAANVTIVGAGAAGFLTFGPSDQNTPGTSTLSYVPGATLANNAIVDFSADGLAGFLVYNGSAASVHFILDVSGYFQ